ncbi:MAG: cyclic-di-AMP receptor [Clostridia bacterium]|nr:cyclic-di-AMP receptor [Clostridia bacterium]
MKLIFAIVHDEDSEKVRESLNSAKLSITKLCSTGGFLRTGNTTFFSVVEDEQAASVIELIEKNSKKRIERIPYPIPLGSFCIPPSREVEIGGATIFVIPVERFENYKYDNMN